MSGEEPEKVEGLEHEIAELRAELEHERSLSRTLMWGLRDALIVYDATGTCLICNRVATSRLGVRQGQGVEAWLEESVLYAEPEGEALAGSGHPLSRALGGQMFQEVEIWVERGRERWWGSVTNIPDVGGVRGGMLIVRDITGAKRREAAKIHEALAAETLTLLQAVSSTLELGIVLADEMLDGFEDPTDSLPNILGDEDPQAWWEYVRGLMRGVKMTTCEVCGRPQRRAVLDIWDEPHERYFEVHFLGHAHGLRPGETRELIIFDDVTSQTRHEQELVALNVALEDARDEAWDASRAKSEFLANMSHELRTPLNAIIGYTELMLEEEDVSNAEDLGRVHAAGKQLLELIGGVLDLSKIESGKMEVFLEDVDVLALCQELVETMTPLMANGVALVLEAPEALALLRTDRTKLRQSLLNLLSNAAKFTRHGSVMLRVGVAGDAVRFEVEDTGPGIAPERQGAIFEAFEQESASIAGSFGGTGLGLAITHHFIVMLGGQLELASVEGEGTTFSFVLASMG